MRYPDGSKDGVPGGSVDTGRYLNGSKDWLPGGTLTVSKMGLPDGTPTVPKMGYRAVLKIPGGEFK